MAIKNTLIHTFKYKIKVLKGDVIFVGKIELETSLSCFPLLFVLLFFLILDILGPKCMWGSFVDTNKNIKWIGDIPSSCRTVMNNYPVVQNGKQSSNFPARGTTKGKTRKHTNIPKSFSLYFFLRERYPEEAIQ